MRSSDLVSLFAGRNDGRGVGFRQGVIMAWNPDTAENLTLIGDTVVQDLPILNTSEAGILKVGDVVGILTSGATWGILGRFTYPGTPEAVSSIQSITNRIQAAEWPGDGYRTSNTYGDLTGANVGPAVSIRIGSSGRALCFWSAEIGQALDPAGTGAIQYQTRNTPHVGVEVTGASSIPAVDFNALNVNIVHPGPGFAGEALTSFWMQSSVFHLFTDLTPGMTTFTMKYRVDTLVPANRSHFNSREIAVFAL